MKRAQLIEWGIIVIAVIFGFKFVTSILSLVIQLIYGLGSYLTPFYIIRTLVITGLYMAAFLLIIKNSYKIARWVCGPDSPQNTLDIKIGKRSLLQVILIAICVSLILSNIADVVYYIFEIFRDEVHTRGLLDPLDNSDQYSPDRYKFAARCIEIVISFIVISFSKNISDWLIRRNEADELVFDSKPEN